jgi:prepilin-type N-terminal cleavage/methylation domain-containing protein
MKNTKKAFTLVELIVVITILAVLATVAFISLTGHAQDAKNTKITSDVAVLAKAIETSLTQGKVNNNSIVTSSTTRNDVDDTATATRYTNAGASDTIALSTAGYKTGLVDFAAIQQNGSDFVDSDGNPYIAGSVSSGSLARYQVAGQIKQASGDLTAIIRGNYAVITGTDSLSLVSSSGSTTPVVNKGSTTGFY